MTKEATLNEEVVDRILNGPSGGKLFSMQLVSFKKNSKAHDKIKEILRAILDSSMYQDPYVAHHFKSFKKKAADKDWEEVFELSHAVMKAWPHIERKDQEYRESSEFFVKLVEDKEKVNVETAEQLQRITGISEEHAKEVFENAMLWRYQGILSAVINGGGTYNDLNLIPAKLFNISKTGGQSWKEYQHTQILTVIKSEFNLSYDLTYSPGLHLVAKKLKAPYSVIMEALQLKID